MSITNIYFSIENAMAIDNQVYIWFDVGRLIRVLSIFPSIELEDPEEDWYYNA